MQFSFLKDVKEFSAPPKAGEKGDKIAAARKKVIDGAKLQITYVDHFLKEKTLPKTAGGKKSVPTWFCQDTKGWMCSVRCGRNAIPLNGTEVFARIPDLAAVKPFLEGVIAATTKGELDPALRKLMEDSKKEETRQAA